MVFGLWMPLAVGAMRAFFGDRTLSWGDLFVFALFYLVGCVSAAAFVSSLRQLPRRVLLVLCVYLPFLPIGVLLALAGTAFGVGGVIVGGTAVFVVPWALCKALARGAPSAAKSPRTRI